MRRVLFTLIPLMLIMTACGGAPAPATQAPAQAPAEQQQLAANTPTLPPPTSTLAATATPVPATSTPAPTATETLLPTLELPTLALNAPALAVWDGLPTYLGDSTPGYYFRVRYDPEVWAQVTDQLGQPALGHRAIPYCLIIPSAGRGVPPSITVEHETFQVNELSIDVSNAYETGKLKFVTYQVSDGTIFTGFEVNFESESETCIKDALTVIETLKSVPTSRATPQP